MFFLLSILNPPVIPPLYIFLFLVAARHIVQTVITLKIKKGGEKQDIKGTLYLASCYIFVLIVTILQPRLMSVFDLYFYMGVLIMEFFVILRMIALLKLGSYFSYEIRISSDHKLIRDGIYAIVRHPLHLAFLGEVLGMAIVGNTIPGYLAVLVLYFVILERNQVEDRILEEKFGEDFKLYKSQVPSMSLMEGYRRFRMRKSGD